MGLILRLRLVDAALDQCHIETIAEPARALFKSLQHVADLTSVITVRLRLRLYTRSMMMGKRNRIKKEVVIFIFIHTARLFANRYLFCHCLVSSTDPGLRRVSVLEEIKCQNYHGCYQQEVNQAGGDKATIKSN